MLLARLTSRLYCAHATHTRSDCSIIFSIVRSGKLSYRLLVKPEVMTYFMEENPPYPVLQGLSPLEGDPLDVRLVQRDLIWKYVAVEDPSSLEWNSLVQSEKTTLPWWQLLHDYLQILKSLSE